MPLPERSVLLVFPNIKNTPPSLYNKIKQVSFHPFQLRVWMSATHKFVRILFYSPPSTRLTALLVSNGRPLTAAAQSRASHISIAHDAMTSSSNVQETGGSKNLIWKEKPKADVQTSASVTANDGNSIYSGSANDFRGAKSAVQASSVNIASNVSANLIAGRAQPVQRFRPVESSVDGIGGTTDSKLSGSKTSVGGRASIGPDSSRNLAIGKGQTGQKTVWVAKGYATHSGSNNGEQGKPSMIAIGGSSSSSSIGAAQVGVKSLSATSGQNVDTVFNRNQMGEEEQSLKGPIMGDFVVDKRAFSRSQIRATFYPKFENEKSDQEIRTKMIEMVSNGKGNLEVSLKHSGSLFMYAGHEGGAYAKNSYGNMYTAVGVFVLSRMLQETWGAQAARKQKELNDFLQNNHMCISMELVTAVLGDHGQRPLQDYVVVTAVTELGAGKPRFYSTADIISFCRKWRLPTNSVWLFSTRKSVASFFLAYDALCEEGTASTVCKAMDEIADISVPGTKDHVEVQGEILEGLVARIVSSESVTHLNKVLEEVPPPPIPEVSCELGQGLREICSANKSSEQQQIKALLRSAGTAMCPDYTDWFGSGASDVMAKASGRSLVLKFIQSHPADYATLKLQEMVRLMTQKKFPADFKCRYNFRKFPYASSNNVHFKMVIHIYNDSGFRRYQKEMREHPGLWPLYRGFFVDVNLFKVSEEKASQMSEDKSLLINHVESSFGARMFEHDDLADEAENLMIKLKFLTYKLRTFLIRNGISTLFKNGPAAYKEYYLRQMKIWGTSHAKIKELSKLLDEWAVYIRRKYGNRQLSSATYLSEAEPFLEQYARQSPQNQALIGSAGTLIKTEDFLVVGQGDLVEEEEFVLKDEKLPLATDTHIDKVSKPQGMIVFFPGIPGCAKSALCRELVNTPGGLGDDRPMHSLMGDLIKGRYWQKVLEERKKKPYEITLADKNAPNEEVWKQIEDMSRSTKAIAVPVVPDSQGTDTNPFDLDALTVFMFRVLQRVNHPGSLDKNSKNAGYVLLMFYNLYEGKTRSDFETELHERFGLLVKMPLLKSDRDPLPDSIKGILNEGLSLYNLHYNRHGKMDCAKGSYAKEWSRWEQRLREILFANADYINAIQVPFEHAVKHVLEDLRAIAKGDYKVVATEKRKLGTIVFAAVSLVTDETKALLDKIADLDSRAKIFIEEKNVKNTLNSAHVTLAHKRAHGVTAVATFGVFRGKQVPVEFTAILFSDKLAALETHLGCIGNEKISSKNEWPHLTIWTGAGATPKEANTLPRLVSEGRAIRIDFKEPFTLTGTVDFF